MLFAKKILLEKKLVNDTFVTTKNVTKYSMKHVLPITDFGKNQSKFMTKKDMRKIGVKKENAKD